MREAESMAEQTRVAVVDDHELVAMAVGGIIDDTSGLTFVRHERSMAALVSRGRDADLVVLDLSLGDDSSPGSNVRTAANWGAPVLILTAAENPYLVREASRTGLHA